MKYPGSDITMNHVREGEYAYIAEAYYRDTDASLVEIPRFGWIVKSLVNEVATIGYRRANRLAMTLIIETKYLRKER